MFEVPGFGGLRFRVRVLVGVPGTGFRVLKVLGFQGFEFGVRGFGGAGFQRFRVWSTGFRVSGFRVGVFEVRGFTVRGFGSGILLFGTWCSGV